jgi:hypothetical protein
VRTGIAEQSNVERTVALREVPATAMTNGMSAMYALLGTSRTAFVRARGARA